MMKRILLTLTVGLLAVGGRAQVMNAKPDDLADLFKRTLVVEFADSTQSMKGGVQLYPHKSLAYLIKAGIEETWKLNAKIEYQSPADLKKNLDRGESRDVYLFLSKHPDSRPGNTIWILNYTKGTSYKEGKVDYEFYLPDMAMRSIPEFTAFDIEFTLTTMQEHMKHVQKSGKKITPMEFMVMDAEKNCKTLKSNPQHVLVDQAYLSNRADEKVLRRSFKRTGFSLLTAEQINNVLAESQDTCAVILVYPGKFEALNTSAMGDKYIFWNKVLVSGSNYKVLGTVGSGRKDNILMGIEGEDISSLLLCE